MSEMTAETAVRFLTDMAAYWEKQSMIGGEDMGFWAAQNNARLCREVADTLHKSTMFDGSWDLVLKPFLDEAKRLHVAETAAGTVVIADNVELWQTGKDTKLTYGDLRLLQKLHANARASTPHKEGKR
jgi:hypothetical protein